jgi:hypothetical protein
VREAQAHWRFDELAAHNMAVLAMAQTALMWQSLQPRLRTASRLPELRRVLHHGAAALWLPLDAMRPQFDPGFTSWDVSADSLALWLARRLHAERLVVVKPCALPADADVPRLTAQGVLDKRFADWAQDAPFPVDVLGADAQDQLRAMLLDGGRCCYPGVAAASTNAAVPKSTAS